MRYRLHHHPAFPNPLTKEDLFLLVEQGSLARGDLCTDMLTSRDHTVGDVITGMRPPTARSQARVGRPAYREIRADGPEEDAEEETDVDEIETLEAQEPEASGDRFTAAGELILYQSHPAWFGYGKVLFLAFLLLIVTGMLLKISPGYALISGLAAAFLITLTTVIRISKDYLVTEERVEVVWGLIGRSSREVRICDIRSIDVYEKGLKGLIGLGNVDFSSSANAGIEVQFRDIRRAHEVKELVRELQRNE